MIIPTGRLVCLWTMVGDVSMKTQATSTTWFSTPFLLPYLGGPAQQRTSFIREFLGCFVLEMQVPLCSKSSAIVPPSAWTTSTTGFVSLLQTSASQRKRKSSPQAGSLLSRCEFASLRFYFIVGFCLRKAYFLKYPVRSEDAPANSFQIIADEHFHRFLFFIIRFMPTFVGIP